MKAPDNLLSKFRYNIQVSRSMRISSENTNSSYPRLKSSRQKNQFKTLTEKTEKRLIKNQSIYWYKNDKSGGNHNKFKQVSRYPGVIKMITTSVFFLSWKTILNCGQLPWRYKATAGQKDRKQITPGNPYHQQYKSHDRSMKKLRQWLVYNSNTGSKRMTTSTDAFPRVANVIKLVLILVLKLFIFFSISATWTHNQLVLMNHLEKSKIWDK